MFLLFCKFGTYSALAKLGPKWALHRAESWQMLWQFPWEELLHASLVGLSGGLQFINIYNSALHK